MISVVMTTRKGEEERRAFRSLEAMTAHFQKNRGKYKWFVAIGSETIQALRQGRDDNDRLETEEKA